MFPFSDGVYWLGLFGGKTKVEISCNNKLSKSECDAEINLERNLLMIFISISSIPAVNETRGFGEDKIKSKSVNFSNTSLGNEYCAKTVLSSIIPLKILSIMLSKTSLGILLIGWENSGGIIFISTLDSPMNLFRIWMNESTKIESPL